MVWNIAHRGGAALMPENTLAAFEDALARGCDGAELDVQLTADGVVVVVHDFRLNRALCRGPDAKLIHGEGPLVKDLTLQQLRRYEVGRADPKSPYARAHPHVCWRDGARIPTLAEVMARVAGHDFWLFVELKSAYEDRALSAAPEALAQATLEVVRAQHYLEHTIFVGFDWRGLIHAHRLAPEIPCWFTTELGAVGPETLEHIHRAGGQGWFSAQGDVTVERIAEARALGLKIGAWTVNEIPDLMRLSGLDALCTDRPDRLKELAALGAGG